MNDETRVPGPLGNPLAGALDAAASWPEAAGYEVPVPTIRRRVRRRRAARRAAVGGGACVLAAGVVVAAPDVWGFLSATPRDALSGADGAPAGGATGSDGRAGVPQDQSLGEAPAGDWAAQFDRCGKAVVEPADAVELRIDDSSTDADATWRAVTRAVGETPGRAVTLLGTDVSLVRDGVVVAVQDGAQVSQPGGSTTPPPGDLGAGRSRWPAVDVEAHLVSCAQYPDGRGSAVVEPGTYELVAVQTLAITSPSGDWTQHAVGRTTVTVPAAG